jgi:DNA mismatch repair protein MutS2
LKDKQRRRRAAASRAAAAAVGPTASDGDRVERRDDPPGATAELEAVVASDGLPEASLEQFAAERLDWPAVRALFERQAASALGRRALSELAPRPPAEARRAHARVGELLASGREEPPLGDLSDPVPLIEQAARFSRALSGDDLCAVSSFLRGLARLSDWLAEHRAALPELAAVLSGAPLLSDLRARLDQGIDSRGQVTDDASPRLAKLRARIRELLRELERAAKTVANRPDLRGLLADGQAGRVHSRGGRMVLAVKAKAAGRIRGIVHEHSHSGETAFVEPEALVPLGNALSSARADEERESSRLLAEWTREVLERREELARAAQRVGQIELAVIGARFCRANGARPPELVEVGQPAVTVLRQARHPLLVEQERGGRIERAVGIDLRLGDPFDVLVITGPNTGGKTLALKTAGLAALLTRLGLPVCAEAGTKVAFYAGVVADIGDEQEVEQSLSTFSSHLARISEGLARADAHTLFLLDELGSGTDPAEGAALGAALLERLLAARIPTLASTHIGRLKEFAFSRARVENASVEFDAESLRPLYRLIVGTPGESRALEIASRLGFDARLVGDARRRLERPSDESQALMSDLRAAREQSERDRAEAERRLAEAAEHQEQLERRAGEIEARARALVDEAQVALERQLTDARAVIGPLRALAARVSAERRTELEALVGRLEAALGAGAMTDRRQEFLAGLRKGAMVYVPRFSKRCPVLRVDREAGRVVVRMGRRELELSIDDVSAFEAL